MTKDEIISQALEELPWSLQQRINQAKKPMKHLDWPPETIAFYAKKVMEIERMKKSIQDAEIIKEIK
jgi:hypothetical protein